MSATNAVASASDTRENFLRRLEENMQQQQQQQQRASSSPTDNTMDNNEHLIQFLFQYSSSSMPSSSSPIHWIQDVDSTSLEFLKSLAARWWSWKEEEGREHTNKMEDVPIIQTVQNSISTTTTTLTPTTSYDCPSTLFFDLEDIPPKIMTTNKKSSQNFGLERQEEKGDYYDDTAVIQSPHSILSPKTTPSNFQSSSLVMSPPSSLHTLPSKVVSSSLCTTNEVQEMMLQPPPPPPPQQQQQQETHQQQPQPPMMTTPPPPHLLLPLLQTILDNQERQVKELHQCLDDMKSSLSRMEANLQDLLRTVHMTTTTTLPSGRSPSPVYRTNDHPPNHPHPHPFMVFLNHDRNPPPPPPLLQGIFFLPSLIILMETFVRSILSIPHRVWIYSKSLLLQLSRKKKKKNGRFGRVFLHLRRRAMDLRPWNNVDIASFLKLFIMLLIFTGRGNGGGGGKNKKYGRTKTGVAKRKRRNNGGRDGGGGGGGQEGGGGGGGGEGGEDIDVYSLLQWMVEYWYDHRMHLLVLSSVIAYLIQIGWIHFLYKVLWLEREDLWKAWNGGPNNNNDNNNENANDDDDNDKGSTNDAVNEVQGERRHDMDENRGGERRLDNNGNGMGGDIHRPPPPPRGDNNVLARILLEAPIAPPVLGVFFRRGPNNGGFFYDVQCFVTSFFLSLIPAWHPEAIIPPEPETGEVVMEGGLPQQ